MAKRGTVRKMGPVTRQRGRDGDLRKKWQNRQGRQQQTDSNKLENKRTDTTVCLRSHPSLKVLHDGEHVVHDAVHQAVYLIVPGYHAKRETHHGTQGTNTNTQKITQTAVEIGARDGHRQMQRAPGVHGMCRKDQRLEHRARPSQARMELPRIPPKKSNKRQSRTGKHVHERRAHA